MENFHSRRFHFATKNKLNQLRRRKMTSFQIKLFFLLKIIIFSCFIQISFEHTKSEIFNMNFLIFKQNLNLLMPFLYVAYTSQYFMSLETKMFSFL